MALPPPRLLNAAVALIMTAGYLLCFSAQAQETPYPKWLAGHRFRVPVTLENTSKAEIPASPICLRFDALAQIGIKRLQNDGDDLCVGDADGKELPRVIEGLNDDQNAARIWVKSTPIPVGGKQTLYIYYGNASAAAPADATAQVFSSVAPKADNAKVTLAFDDLSPEVKPLEIKSLIAPRAVAGYYGKGAWFNGQNAAFSTKVTDITELSKSFTISMWYKPIPHKAVGRQYIASIDNAIFILEGLLRMSDGGEIVDIPYTPRYSEWNHLAVTYDGANVIFFLNGEEVGRKPVKNTPKFQDGVLSLGYNPSGVMFFSNEVLDNVVVTAQPRTIFSEAFVPPVQTLGKEEVNSDAPAPPDPPRPDVILPMEAESFDGVVGRDDWKMFETLGAGKQPQYFRSHYRDYLSRNYGVFTLGTGATIMKTLNVPKDGTYQLWVRYVPIGEHEYELRPTTGSGFLVKAEQNGQVVGTQQYGSTLDYDPRTARWESKTFSLKKGLVKWSVIKNIEDPGAAEKLDTLVLTNEKNWVPDARSLGSVWLRFHFLEVDGPGPYSAYYDVLRHDGNPWYKQYFINESKQKVKAGYVSPWIDGKTFASGTYEVTLTLGAVDPQQVFAERMKVAVDYARLPFESSIYKIVTQESTRTMGFIVPGTTGESDVFETDSMSTEEASKRHLNRAIAARWPKDNQPKSITVSLNASLGGFNDATVRNEMTTLKMMGANHITSAHSGWGSLAGANIAKELGIDKTTMTFFIHFGYDHKISVSPYDPKFWEPVQKNLDLLIKQIRKRSGEEEIKHYTWLMLNDEVEEWLPPPLLGKQPPTVEAFKKWLDNKKITPASLGLKSWDELQWVFFAKDATTPEQKKLWMLEMDFSTDNTTFVYKKAQEMVEKALGHPVYTTILPSPHGYMPRGFAETNGNGMNYFKFWQDGGTTMPLTEDWSYENGLLYISAEFSAYAAELLRMGADHTRPTMMYVTTGGVDARKQKVYASLARGVKHINHYVYGPSWANSEGSWTHLPKIFESIGFVNADIAHTDDLLDDAQQRKTPVAILYPWSSDVWFHHRADIAERFHVFLSLAHEQAPVELVSEEQVAAGTLEGRKVLYVLGTNVRRDAIVAIAKWVNRGGTLVTTMDGGSKDEYDADSTSFDTILGLNKRTLTEDPNNNPKADYLRGGLEYKKQIGTVTFTAPFPTAQLKAYAMKTVANVKGAKVVGTWEDGSPAATINTSGQGRAIWMGALPGLAYVKGSNMTPEGLTTEYPADVRGIINAPITMANVARDVEVSTPLVEATLQESAKGAVVTLINYTMKPIASDTVIARPSKPVKRVVSVTTGKDLPFTKTVDGVSFKMPIGLAEFVKLYY